ncbi:MAG: hypothetical protein ED559_06175 [Phycisphaera sp.]|nr:MAG: hypothetical protein ED559_06175 [Phycisphaera sp.]
MRVLDTPPDLLFKYLKRDIYETHLLHGRARLGPTSLYRSQFESGAGYADADDGVRAARVPELQKTIRTANDHFLYCCARSYSYDMHAEWLNRSGCGYDVCAVMDGPMLIDAIARAVKATIGPRLILCGCCKYGCHTNQVGSLKGNLFGDAFLKPIPYAKEDEYRLAVAFSREDVPEVLDVSSAQIPQAIRQVISLSTPAK